MFHIVQRSFFIVGLITSLTAMTFGSHDKDPRKNLRRKGPVNINITSAGPTQAAIDVAKRRAERSVEVQSFLKGAKYRLINFEYLEEDLALQLPARCRVYFYDYSNDRTIIAEGDFASKRPLSVRQEKSDPGVTDEELVAAFDIIKADGQFGPLFKSNSLRMADAMPAISNLNGERLVNVGIELTDGTREVVGISFKNDKVVHYANNAPPTSRATPDACGVPSAGQPTTSNGTAGQYQMAVTQNGNALWDMLVIRPSASSGNSSERSGIEIRDVKYKGKSVLKRAHAPILNVKYAGNTCGPYRDWQYQEGMFDAPATGATDIARGIRLLAGGQIAQTVMENGTDTGNFRGVAVYRQDTETVLVTEMSAGWYRYVMEWRFDDDGTIRPRYGFGATDNSCVCFAHYHHVYWRFDFDIVSSNNSIYPVTTTKSGTTPIATETALIRDTTIRRGSRFLIKNSDGFESYMLSPNRTDGKWDDGDPTFGAGDFWLLKFQGTAASPDELDDPNTSSAANLAPWVNGESIVGTDIVIWYAAHFAHTDGANLLDPNHISPNILAGNHVVGPEIRPYVW